MGRYFCMLSMVIAFLVAQLGPVGAASGGGTARPQGGGETRSADFDGDGYEDLAIGVPDEEVNGFLGAGAVNVLYGGSVGLSATGDQLWHQDAAGVLDAAEQDDAFGSALAAGDFDDDGYDDLAIGVPGEDLDLDDIGAVNVLYGSSVGLTANLDQFWNQTSGSLNDPAETGDEFGNALSVGDYDGDGYDDLAVGIHFEDVTINEHNGGAVNVIYGSVVGLGVGSNQFWSQDSAGIRDAPAISERFGYSLATGDFDGDGYDDLAIGVINEDSAGGISGIGAVAVLYGTSSNGLTEARDQLWTQDSSGIQGVGESLDHFGEALAAGDLDGNGEDDLVVGVPDEDVGTVANAGAVNVIYGSNSGLSSTSDQVWTQDSSGIADSAETDDQMGFALAVGYFDGDEFADMAAGVIWDDIGGGSNAGAVNVIYGSVTGLHDAGDLYLHQDSGGVLGVAEGHDHLGSTLVALDWGDGPEDDLTIGVPDEELSVGSAAGAVNTIYGDPGGLTSGGNQLWHQDTSGVLGNAEAGDRFGGSFGVGS